jgi:hypothetical protein
METEIAITTRTGVTGADSRVSYRGTAGWWGG